MKIFFAFFIALCSSHFAHAQNPGTRLGCRDTNLLVQAEMLKTDLQKQGFEVMHDGMLRMESKQEFPVMVGLQAGKFYQIVFIGNTRAKSMGLRFFDPNKTQMMERNRQPLKQTSNVINFSFTPAETGNYMFMLEQVIKLDGKTEACGSFTIYRLNNK